MNWLQRARCEIGKSEDAGPANSAERNPTALLAVASAGESQRFGASIGGHADQDDQNEAFEERAAIMEFDGGMSRSDGEWAARLMTGGLKTVH